MRKLYYENDWLKIIRIEENEKVREKGLVGINQSILSKIEKTKALRETEVVLYHKWMEEHLSLVCKRDITQALLDKSGLTMSAIGKGGLKDAKEFMCEILAEEVEFCRFLAERLEWYLCEMSRILTSRDLCIEDKRQELEVDFWMYDIYRYGAFDFYEYHVSPICSERIVYIDKQGISVDVDEVFDRVDSLSFPFDLRACEMFFGMYRIAGTEDKLVWSLYYTLEYMRKLFFACGTVAFAPLGTRPTPKIEDIIYTMGNVLDSEVKQLVDELDLYGNDIKRLDEYSLWNTVEFRQIRNQIGVDGVESDHENVIRRMYALAHSLEPIDLVISIFSYLLEEKSKIDSGDYDWFRSVCKQFKKYRQDILFYTYEYDDVYDKEHKRLDVREIVEAEKHLEEQLNLCDQFDKILSLVEVENMEDLMKEKYAITKRLSESGAYPRYVVERLSNLMNKVVSEIESAITAKDLHSIYLSDVNALLNKADKIKGCNLKEFTKMLSSAEYLYFTFIQGKEKREDIDYSFVSLLYFTALENLLCNSFYIPFVAKMCNELQSSSVNKEKFKDYFDEQSYYYITKDRKIQRTCELGKMGNILSQNYPYKMVQYLERKLGIRDLDALKQLGNKVAKASWHRNKAAHGTDIVTYDDVVGAKQETYVKTVENEIDVYRGLIAEFLHLIHS